MYKIYKIVDNTNNNVYIGQTKKKYLSQRIGNHVHAHKKYKDCSSSIILKNNDWYAEIIEETDDIKREKYWINNTPNCINKRTLIYGKGKGDPEQNKRYCKNRYHFINSWGGDPRTNNNLLSIDAETIFY